MRSLLRFPDSTDLGSGVKSVRGTWIQILLSLSLSSAEILGLASYLWVCLHYLYLPRLDLDFKLCLL